MSYTPEQIAEKPKSCARCRIPVPLNGGGFCPECPSPLDAPTIEKIVAQTRKNLRDPDCYGMSYEHHEVTNLVAIIEQQRERITALKAKADLACAALVGAGKEIVSLKQCHHCKHGDHRHAADTKRCINTIERRCQCEENPA